MILKEKIYPIIEFTAPLSKDQTEAPPLELMWVFKKNFWMEKCQKSSTAISPWLFTDDAEKLQRVKRNIGNEKERENILIWWEFENLMIQRVSDYILFAIWWVFDACWHLITHVDHVCLLSGGKQIHLREEEKKLWKTIWKTGIEWKQNTGNMITPSGSDENTKLSFQRHVSHPPTS